MIASAIAGREVSLLKMQQRYDRQPWRESGPWKNRDPRNEKWSCKNLSDILHLSMYFTNHPSQMMTERGRVFHPGNNIGTDASRVNWLVECIGDQVRDAEPAELSDTRKAVIGKRMIQNEVPLMSTS